jgi:A/G-specific adenine glycosylase
MPWRQRPTPYHVWLSEVMLQQTQVATVIPYFERFVARFPDATSLAAAEETEVLRLWEGLGYYRRARQLHRAAKEIVERHGGVFPSDREAVLALPGIGRYTAGAILSIAFGAREPIVEANTKRVLSRLLAYRGDVEKSEGQQLLWQFAEELLPRTKVSEFNQSLMELGSEICTPRSPACGECPVASLCPTRALGLEDQIPAPRKKPKIEAVTEAAVVIRRRGKIFLRRREEGERWAGLWDFPRFAIAPQNGEQDVADEIAAAIHGATGLRIEPTRCFAILRHGVTRFRITLHCWEARHISGRTGGNGRTAWLGADEFADYPLSVTGRKISNLLLKNSV